MIVYIGHPYHVVQASIVIMVHTAVGHRHSRNLIRQTWGRTFLHLKPSRLLFAIGNQLFMIMIILLVTLLPGSLDHHEEDSYDDDHYDADDDATGVTEDDYEMRSVKAEAMLFGDILQGSFIDSYR